MVPITRLIKREEDALIIQRDEEIAGRDGEDSKVRLVTGETKESCSSEVKRNKKEEEQAAQNAQPVTQDALRVKKEFDGDFLPPRTVLGLMDGLEVYDLSLGGEDLDTQLSVSRDFISKTFGGGIRRTFPEFSAENKEKVAELGFGEHGWACLKNYNPYAPSIPGHPGLYFNCCELHDDLTQDFTWHRDRCRVFSCLDNAKWLRVGLYDFEYVATLTVDEWKGLPHKAIVAWRMRCVGYEEKLQRHVVTKVSKPEPRGKKQAPKRGTKRGRTTEDAQKGAPSKRRKGPLA
ncbi:hypothetical protein V5O48_001536 [Marasmius crinis-equi]|uniref:DUF6697 domain-containing protein n=1 Tax=Marasmius crinis-equi TaxID=585013 RepID=A0ABR3FYM4_9AGAR